MFLSFYLSFFLQRHRHIQVPFLHVSCIFYRHNYNWRHSTIITFSTSAWRLCNQCNRKHNVKSFTTTVIIKYIQKIKIRLMFRQIHEIIFVRNVSQKRNRSRSEWTQKTNFVCWLRKTFVDILQNAFCKSALIFLWHANYLSGELMRTSGFRSNITNLCVINSSR